MSDRFDQFLLTGRLGPVHVGLSQDEVRATLGPPYDTGFGKRSNLWSYGGHFLQMFFESKRLIGFGLYFWHPPRMPPALTMDIPFSEAWTLQPVARYLSERGMPYAYAGEPAGRIRVADDTDIIFDDGGELQKILTCS